MPAIDRHRPQEFVAVPRPTPDQMEILRGVLVTLELDLRKATRGAYRRDFDPENASHPALAFGVVCQLLTELQYAQPCPEPDPTPLPPVVTLEDGSTVKTRTPAKKTKPKAVRQAKRFDFAALPPRVEAGC